jgi:hypothetical protein
LYSSATGSIASADADDVGPTGDVDLVVAERGCERRLGDVRLDLVVLFDDDELAAEHFHLAAGRVLKAHHQPGLRLLAVGFQRPGLAVDMRDLDFFCLRKGGAAAECECSGNDRSDEAAHVPSRE